LNKQTTRRNGDIGFDNSIFPNGEITNLEPPGQHYLPLHDSNPGHSNHRYERDSDEWWTDVYFSDHVEYYRVVLLRLDLALNNFEN
jgi:hypothetical protein